MLKLTIILVFNLVKIPIFVKLFRERSGRVVDVERGFLVQLSILDLCAEFID